MGLTVIVTIDMELATDLLSAQSGGELFPVFQPQLDLGTRSIVAAEVLCRWRHPLRGLVPPEDFIRVAEETGSIRALGRLMLNHGLDLIAHWHKRNVAIQASVNVSPVQLTDGRFVDHLQERLEQHAISAGSLIVEITESQPLGDAVVVVRELERLRSAGIGVALDDFGTGHASTAQLEQLPVSEVKLDRLLIQSLSPEVDDVLMDTMRLARERDLRVVAEGVETEAQFERAVELGCDRIQGFLVSRPLGRPAFDALLEQEQD